MFCLNSYYCFKLYMLILQFMLILLIIIGLLSIFDCFFHFRSFVSLFLSIQSNLFNNIKWEGVYYFDWRQLLHKPAHSIYLMHSHSYFINHIFFFIFGCIKFLLKILPWSYNLFYYNNHCHKQVKSSCSFYTDTIVSNSTC